MLKINSLSICFLALNLLSSVGFSRANSIEAKNLKEEKSISVEKSINSIKDLPDIQFNLVNNFSLLAENIEKNIVNDESLNGIEVTSDTKSLENNSFTAEGNVLVKKNNMMLKANKLKYNKQNKIIIITGNINFKSGDQFISSSKIEYDLKNKIGYIENAYGSLNFDNLDDLLYQKDKKNINNNFEEDKSIRNVQLNQTSNIGLESINLKTDLNDFKKWRFFSKKIKIEDDIWTAKKLFLTNDPFNNPQLVIQNKNFSSFDQNGEIMVRSKWSTIVLDNFIRIPAGRRSYKVTNKGQNFRWSLGYDKKDKDGLFISRNSDTISIDKNKTTIDLKKYFFIQRALAGKTKSFSKKNDSVLGTKVKQESKELDLFGLDIELNSELLGFNLYSNAELNSLDLDKFKKIISSKTDLSRVLYKEEKNNMQKETLFTIFANYRDKVWNGSLGESEILGSYGAKVKKENNWTDNNVFKSSTLAIGYGNYKSAKRLDSEEIIDRKRLNIFLERNHTYPIWKPEIAKKFITSEYKYTPSVISYGLNLFLQTKADFYRYSDNNFQNLFTFRAGPELTLGNFKKSYLDYSKLSILSKTTISSGLSPFSFDQPNDLHSIEFKVEQQLLGPLTLKLSTEYNLDLNSEKYKELYNNKIEIGLNRRAYKISAYYIEDREEGGINFKIHSFNFKGIGKSFK